MTPSAVELLQPTYKAYLIFWSHAILAVLMHVFLAILETRVYFSCGEIQIIIVTTHVVGFQLRLKIRKEENAPEIQTIGILFGQPILTSVRYSKHILIWCVEQ